MTVELKNFRKAYTWSYTSFPDAEFCGVLVDGKYIHISCTFDSVEEAEAALSLYLSVKQYHSSSFTLNEEYVANI